MILPGQSDRRGAPFPYLVPASTINKAIPPSTTLNRTGLRDRQTDRGTERGGQVAGRHTYTDTESGEGVADRQTDTESGKGVADRQTDTENEKEVADRQTDAESWVRVADRYSHRVGRGF